MMVRLRSKTTQITATISPFRADPGGTQIPIVILSTRIQIFLHFGSINGLSLSVYLRTNLAGTLMIQLKLNFSIFRQANKIIHEWEIVYSP